MIAKSEYRFSEKIVLNKKLEPCSDSTKNEKAPADALRYLAGARRSPHSL
jgi:hypothetical protein